VEQGIPGSAPGGTNAKQSPFNAGRALQTNKVHAGGSAAAPDATQRLNQADPKSVVGSNEMPGGKGRIDQVLHLGLRINSINAQFLFAATGPGDARHPRNGVIARRQFQHHEAAIELWCPWIAALCNQAVG
jgi:hypothetical protein